MIVLLWILAGLLMLGFVLVLVKMYADENWPAPNRRPLEEDG